MPLFLCLILLKKKKNSFFFLTEDGIVISYKVILLFIYLSFYCSYDFDCSIWFLVAYFSFIFPENFDTKKIVYFQSKRTLFG